MLEVMLGDLNGSFMNTHEHCAFFAVDLETDGLDPLAGSVAHVCTVWCHRCKAGAYVRLGQRYPSRLKEIIQNRQVLFHYAVFDLSFLYRQFKIVANHAHCTKLAAKIIDPRRINGSQSLEPLLTRYGIAEIAKNTAIRTGDWTVDPTDAMMQYAQDDVQYLWPLHVQLIFQMNMQQLEKYNEAVAYLPTFVQEKIDYNGGLYGH